MSSKHFDDFDPVVVYMPPEDGESPSIVLESDSENVVVPEHEDDE